MGKTANCIRMLQLLKSRKKMSREELANELNTNIRNISVYKNELSEAGYLIDSTPGIGGGYFLVNGPLLPSLRFSEQEEVALDEAQLLLQNQMSYLRYEDYERAMDKIRSSYNAQEVIEPVYIGKRTMFDETLVEWIDRANDAVQNYNALEITYRSLKDDQASTFMIHPYRMMMYKDAYYCLAYSLKRKEFRIYKFSKERMQECKTTNKRFNPDPDFSVGDYIGQLNFMKNQRYEVKCSIYGDTAIRIAEREVGIEVSKGWSNDVLELTTIMEGDVEAISFLMSLGGDVVVHEPKVLKNKLLHEANKMIERYQK